ncbi:MAG: hypothetical protein ACI8Q3_001008 [Marinomonas primoryensis]|jgi:hypothetical protein
MAINYLFIDKRFDNTDKHRQSGEGVTHASRISEVV